MRVSRAFTLLELLVGLTVATLIVTAAAGVFVATLDAWQRGSESAQLLQAGRTAADTIERHLRGALPPELRDDYVFQGEDLSDEAAFGHRLTLASANVARFPRAESAADAWELEITYDPVETDGLTLRLDPSPDNEYDTGGYLMDLAPGVTSFQVLYYDNGEWLEDWYRDELPHAVEFHLTLEAVDPAADPDAEPTRDDDGPPRRSITVSRIVTLPMAGEAANDEEPPL